MFDLMETLNQMDQMETLNQTFDSNHQGERTRIDIAWWDNFFSLTFPSLSGNHRYTEEALDKLNKKEFITILLSLQSKVESANNEILDQVRQLNQNNLNKNYSTWSWR